MGTLSALAGVIANACLVYIGAVFFKDAYKHHKENKDNDKGGNKR